MKDEGIRQRRSLRLDQLLVHSRVQIDIPALGDVDRYNEGLNPRQLNHRRLDRDVLNASSLVKGPQLPCLKVHSRKTIEKCVSQV